MNSRAAPARRRSLKRRIVVPLAGGLALLLCTFVLLFYWTKRKEIETVRESDRVSVMGYVRSRSRSEADMMRAVLRTITLDSSMVGAFRARDRDALLAMAAPIHERLARDHRITIFSFLTPDQRTFLDVADPAGTTSYAGGATLARALAGDTMVAGVELGPARAPLSLRVVAPTFQEGRLVGFIELGLGLHHLGPDVADVLGVELVATLDKRYVDRAVWDRTARSLEPAVAWDEHAGHVVLYHSQPMVPPSLAGLLASSGPFETQDFELDHQGRHYYAAILPLRDAARRDIGAIIVLRDQTALIAAARRSIAIAGLVALAIGLICGWLLYRAVRQHFLDPIVDLHAAATRKGEGPDRASAAAILSGYEMDDLAHAIDGLMADLQKAQEEHTRLIIDAALDAVVTIDAQNTIIGWNRQAETIFGWTRDEAIGRTLSETIIPPASRAAHERGFKAHLANGGGSMLGRRVETEAMRRDGSIVPVELAITRLEVEGQLIFSGFIRDITERTRTEEALRASDSRFRRLVELANVVPWEADVESLRFGYIDPRIVKLLGYPAVEWDDATWIDHIHPEDRDAAVGKMRDAIARRAEVEIEYRMVAAEGYSPWIRDIVSADQAASPNPLLRGFRFDITERKRLEEQLYGSQKMEAIGRLAGGVAHDFNNLTTAILGYAGFIHAQLPDDHPLRDDVSEISRAANRAADLTQQLLAFARRRVIQPRVVEPAALVRATEKMLRRLIGENIALSTASPPDLWPVRVDPGQFEQVLVNLVVNARDAMPEGGRLHIELANTELRDSPGQRPAINSGPFVMIAVSDTGIGMDEQTKARIFEPFFTTKRVGEGTGLGLASCYGIIKQAGGYIFAFSEVGKGTTLRIYLPRAEEAPAETESQEAPAPRPGGHETILVAEDQPQVRRLAERALRARGYHVITAEDGARAVALAADHHGPIHLLLSDMVMPLLGGRDAAARIREHRPDIRVLFMSGYSEHEVLNPGSRDEAMGFLAKPFTPHELENAVRSVLDGTVAPLAEAV